MANLSEPLKIRNLILKNRICIPPMVCFGLAGDDGVVTDQNVEHYRTLAQNHPGLIIQEAACVLRDGRLSASQLGIWDDAHIPGLKRITDAVHAADCPIILQIHHAGISGMANPAYCPSDYTMEKSSRTVSGREMTAAQIEEVEAAFAAAAQRAVLAGYDGVELHGCHAYLLSQFLNRRVNRRADPYGDDPCRIVEEIFQRIRAVVPPDFIVGIRMGAFQPTLSDGLSQAKRFCEIGLDYLSVSYGFQPEQDCSPSPSPDLYDVTWAAGEIKKAASVPVFAVYGIQTLEQAQRVLDQTGVDLACIGRAFLINPHFITDSRAGRKTGRCLDCMRCYFMKQSRACPGVEQKKRTV